MRKKDKSWREKRQIPSHFVCVSIYFVHEIYFRVFLHVILYLLSHISSVHYSWDVLSLSSLLTLDGDTTCTCTFSHSYDTYTQSDGRETLHYLMVKVTWIPKSEPFILSASLDRKTKRERRRRWKRSIESECLLSHRHDHPLLISHVTVWFTSFLPSKFFFHSQFSLLFTSTLSFVM